jgi:hypothetical protein
MRPLIQGCEANRLFSMASRFALINGVGRHMDVLAGPEGWLLIGEEMAPAGIYVSVKSEQFLSVLGETQSRNLYEIPISLLFSPSGKHMAIGAT